MERKTLLIITAFISFISLLLLLLANLSAPIISSIYKIKLTDSSTDQYVEIIGVYGYCYTISSYSPTYLYPYQITECDSYQDDFKNAPDSSLNSVLQFLMSVHAIVLTIMSITFCFKNNNIRPAIWISVIGLVVILATMIGDIVLFSIIVRKNRTSPLNLNITLGPAFAFVVLSVVCTSFLIFLFWKINRIPQETQYLNNDEGAYNPSEVVGTTTSYSYPSQVANTVTAP
ncbi:10306_t:CDS:2 [Cetraspora pellucida]|uniref:10306_t:CDS:1 n=1 Tax=Cetraspora pellucida TaxID=1433469 RepID=A0A9N9F1N2_9GLOM|nr:10306_t:CDS:2 [Cetraspora pellucida]